MANATLLFDKSKMELEYVDDSIEVEDSNSEINNGDMNCDMVICCKFGIKSKTKMRIIGGAI